MIGAGFYRALWRCGLIFFSSASLLVAELLPYGDFEGPDLSSWSETGGAVLVTDIVYEGLQAARTGGGDLRAVFATEAGQTYRVTGWVRIVAESGSDWGGFRVAISDFSSWQELDNTGALLTATHGSDWFRISLTFEAIASSSRLQIGYFGGSARQMTVHVDAFSAVPFDANEPPAIVAASLTPDSMASLPGNQTFSITAMDPDGTIETIHWDFGDGLASWRLDAANPILFQGFQSSHAALVPGRSYRIGARWMTEDITGPLHSDYPFGLCLKFVGWPEPGETESLPVLVPHAAGDTPWHWAEADFIATTDFLPNLGMILENATGGAGYIDEVSLREMLSDNRLGPELLRGARANAHVGFDARRGAGLEFALAAAQANQVYIRLVIAEKQDWIVNHLGPAGTPAPNGEQFYAGPGTAGRFLHESYWRYLFARYGTFRSVHSWELVNEAAPGDGPHFALTARLAELARADGNPHPASISTWATLPPDPWNNPDYAAIDHADFHAYVRNTGWLEPRQELANDSARFFHAYDVDARARVPGMPIIWGEQGIDGPDTTDEEDEDIALDVDGVWLHKMTWARCGPGGVIPLYWWPDNIFAHGTLAWLYDAGRAITGAPCLIDGLVLVGTQAGHVHALHAASGEVVWVSPRLGPSIHGGLTAGDGRVFTGTEDMVVHALSLTNGVPLAHRQVRGQSFRMLWPMLHAGRVWVSSVMTPIIGSEYVGESNLGSFLFADSPTLSEEEDTILRWLDGDTNNGRWPDAGADWQRLFALNVEDLSEPFIIPAASARRRR